MRTLITYRQNTMTIPAKFGLLSMAFAMAAPILFSHVDDALGHAAIVGSIFSLVFAVYTALNSGIRNL